MNQKDSSDLADMECMEHQTASWFIELRSCAHTGRILGFTSCGSSASELGNEMGVAITNKLTALDVAGSLHSYPSNGYLLHRICLALAFSCTWGVLESYGFLGVLIGKSGRSVSRGIGGLQKSISWLSRKVRNLNNGRETTYRSKVEWEAVGERATMLLVPPEERQLDANSSKATSPIVLSQTQNKDYQLLSFLEVYSNTTLCEQLLDQFSNIDNGYDADSVVQKGNVEYTASHEEMVKLSHSCLSEKKSSVGTIGDSFKTWVKNKPS